MDTKQTSPVRAKPNVTPRFEKVDAMLVVLILFLVTVPMIVRGFRAEPPEATSVAPRAEF